MFLDPRPTWKNPPCPLFISPILNREIRNIAVRGTPRSCIRGPFSCSVPERRERRVFCAPGFQRVKGRWNRCRPVSSRSRCEIHWYLQEIARSCRCWRKACRPIMQTSSVRVFQTVLRSDESTTTSSPFVLTSTQDERPESHHQRRARKTTALYCKQKMAVRRLPKICCVA